MSTPEGAALIVNVAYMVRRERGCRPQPIRAPADEGTKFTRRLHGRTFYTPDWLGATYVRRVGHIIG